MAEIRSVKLELLRPGPAHNQLLSPLTPYMALCGADGPVTLHMPFEHQQLLSRLERLRYVTDGVEVSAPQREAEVHELGEAVGRVLGHVPALLSEIASARSERSDLVHLRLAMTAYELALVPFEFAIGADGFPGSGAPLFLQSTAPITVTREVRRGRPLPVSWNRPPRILFAFAAPDGLPPVPAQEHLASLRRAIDPWVKWKPPEHPEERLPDVKALLTVLPNASLQRIRRECASAEYTHVHILAHGEPIGRDDSRHYGLCLCNDSDGTAKDVVSGDALATALTSQDAPGKGSQRPTLVSLASCDSGHAGSVVTPGGSIAHALHAGGIPWVIASQFPLWMRASSIAVEVLYEGMLRGDDPRWTLFTLRQRLRTDSTRTHDWASIVAYAAVPHDFDEQIEAFRNRQTRQRIEVKFDQAEQILRRQRDATAAASGSADHGELELLYGSVRRDLERWRDALPQTAPGRERAERFGMSAASEKRIGNLFRMENKDDKARAAYEKACGFYRHALDADPFSHWAMTQHLSMMAVLAPEAGDAGLAREYGGSWQVARHVAEWDLQKASGEQKAWALASLVELELLRCMYDPDSCDPEKSKRDIGRMCQDLLRAVPIDAFAVFSTRRQLTRDRDEWARSAWSDLAKAGIEALGDGASWVGRAYPGPNR